MVAVPAPMAVIVPVVAFTVATDGLLLLHVPPVALLLTVAVAPAQSVALPPLIVPANGVVFTVIKAVSVAVPHVPVTEYVIIATPVAAAVTTPAALIVAIDGLLLLQLPPDKVLLSVRVPDTHI